ncbi:hypothetical protein DAPPUDRAFT_257416 [Daphnia pulex]|uniref:Uncharacterized protein n=1 Tax=Daphnia pulex TaxID=6669 RepID=E9HDI7_DAPPU|nr:hypothetical protein DAPPUDRAFT_257416 [Daphnia pulex]|eukprot:EFX70202.1 hypothetical protein DAPPUDRAFT_257416 [Daphnia pulex]
MHQGGTHSKWPPCTQNTQALDLILANQTVKMDGRDESGRTALHFATASSNVVAVRYLEMRENTNLFDSHGRSPLHSAAFFVKTRASSIFY